MIRLFQIITYYLCERIYKAGFVIIYGSNNLSLKLKFKEAVGMNDTTSFYLMNAKETAEFLHISYWNLMDLVRRKKIPHIRYSRQVFFKRETLENFINELECNSVR